MLLFFFFTEKQDCSYYAYKYSFFFA